MNVTLPCKVKAGTCVPADMEEGQWTINAEGQILIKKDGKVYISNITFSIMEE